MEAAWRRVAASWLVTAPTARNMTAVATMARAKYSEEPTAIPMFELRPDKNCDDGGCHPQDDGSHPKPADRQGGARAAVSSGPPEGGPIGRSPPRHGATSCWSGVPHTAPRTMSVMEILKTVKPPTVWSWGAGPKSALIALFDP